MQYHDNMTPEESAQLLAECDALDQAYADAEAFCKQFDLLWIEWHNMRDGAFYWDNVVDDEEHWNEFRRAALDHRGRP